MVREVSLFSMSRALILSTLERYEPLSKEELAKKTGLSRASVYHHLEELKERGLIREKVDKEKLGHPIFITTEKANPIALELLKTFKLIFPDLFKQKGGTKKT